MPGQWVPGSTTNVPGHNRSSFHAARPACWEAAGGTVHRHSLGYLSCLSWSAHGIIVTRAASGHRHLLQALETGAARLKTSSRMIHRRRSKVPQPKHFFHDA